MSAAIIIWAAAGRPAPQDAEPYTDRCWWCGQPSHGLGRPVSTLPATFPDHHRAALGDATHLCEPCGWSLSDGTALPVDVAEGQVAGKLAPEGSGRIKLLLDEEHDPKRKGVRVLAARLADGSVGVWQRPQAAAERRWTAALDDLTADPRSIDGCELLAVMSAEELLGRVCGKFRNFDHLATPDGWRALKSARASDRDEIRGVCIDPPAAEWVLVIGDGQKHAAIHGLVSDGRDPVQVAYLEGAGLVRWRPADLRRLIAAVESLRLARVRDEEILAGDYHPSTPHAVLAIRRAEPVIAPHRGRVLMFALALSRRRKEIPDGETPQLPGSAGVPRPTQRPAPLRAGDVVPDRPRLPDRGQLPLFGD